MTLLPIPGLDKSIKGKFIALSPQRKFVCDLMRYSKKVPSVPSQRRMHLGDVVSARRSQPRHVSWCAIFLKAYAIVSAANPQLRRCYLPFLWPHIYEHPINVASFSLERTYRGEEGVFFAHVPRPELLSLQELDALVRHHKTADVDSIPHFRQAMILSRLPLPLRRLLWWLALYTDGAARAHFFGTYAVSVVAAFGAGALHILSPLTTTLHYGTFDDQGAIDVRLTYDHRVMDGATIARALTALEEVLQNEICAELQALAAPAPTRQAVHAS
jgi:hypothetical protein